MIVLDSDVLDMLDSDCCIGVIVALGQVLYANWRHCGMLLASFAAIRLLSLQRNMSEAAAASLTVRLRPVSVQVSIYFILSRKYFCSIRLNM